MIIPRPAYETRLNELKKWTFVFGRRKTGKTFLVRNFLKSDESFFIKNSRTILTKDSTSISYETFLEIIKRELQRENVIVVDEFHRLGEDFFDFLHHLEKKGRLVLISSTMNLSKKLLSKKSALLGLFAEFPLGIIDLNDILTVLHTYKIPKKDLLELAIFLREPLSIDYFDTKKRARTIIADILIGSKQAVPALIGEVFSEETRELSAIYEGLLRAIALGMHNSGEMASFLFSKRVIKKEDPSIIQQHLQNLLSFGLIKKTRVFNKKKYSYFHTSPLAQVFYYMDEKYNFGERTLSQKEVLTILDQLIPKIVEDSIREELARKTGLEEMLYIENDFEIDGILVKFKKPQVALEVKWTDMKQQDIPLIEKKLSRVRCSENIIFVQDKKSLQGNVWDVLDLL